VSQKTPAPVPVDPSETVTPTLPVREELPLDTQGVPSPMSDEARMRRRTPATPGPGPSGPRLTGELQEVGDEELEIVGPAVPAAPPAAPPIPAEASGRVAPKRGVTPEPVSTDGAVTAPLPASGTAPMGSAGRLRVPTPPPIPSSALPEALAQRTGRRKRSKPWFEEVFDEDYLRTLPFMTAEQTVRESDFIERSLGLGQGASALDVGCGYGRHAIELTQRGYAVTGLDLSLPLLIRAADESQRRGLAVNFVHADMRELSFDGQFEGAYSMLTTFGYFDEETNFKVAEGIARALKPGGRFLVDVVNRDYVVSDLPARVWWEGDGCVVLEEVEFNFHTSRILSRRSIVFEDGRQIEQELSIRAYSLHELGKLLRNAGFRVLDVSGGLALPSRFFGANSRNLIVLCEKRADGE